mmetsp:Transcript_40112/g.113734  ORF Transcript_40112/g.113734 Transcript_40112/m.113734 type:complete len:477 (+) Transcript_40112:578-2008(+)
MPLVLHDRQRVERPRQHAQLRADLELPAHAVHGRRQPDAGVVVPRAAASDAEAGGAARAVRASAGEGRQAALALAPEVAAALGTKAAAGGGRPAAEPVHRKQRGPRRGSAWPAGQTRGLRVATAGARWRGTQREGRRPADLRAAELEPPGLDAPRERAVRRVGVAPIVITAPFLPVVVAAAWGPLRAGVVLGVPPALGDGPALASVVVLLRVAAVLHALLLFSRHLTLALLAHVLAILPLRIGATAAAVAIPPVAASVALLVALPAVDLATPLAAAPVLPRPSLRAQPRVVCSRGEGVMHMHRSLQLRVSGPARRRLELLGGQQANAEAFRREALQETVRVFKRRSLILTPQPQSSASALWGAVGIEVVLAPVGCLHELSDTNLRQLVVAQVQLQQRPLLRRGGLDVVHNRPHGIVRELVLVEPQGDHLHLRLPESAQQEVDRLRALQPVASQIDGALGIARVTFKLLEQLRKNLL